jgi:hypothetical protein
LNSGNLVALRRYWCNIIVAKILAASYLAKPLTGDNQDPVTSVPSHYPTTTRPNRRAIAKQRKDDWDMVMSEREKRAGRTRNS